MNSLGVNPIRRRRVWVGTFAGLAVMTLLVSGSGCTIMEPSGQKSPAIRRAVVSDGWLAMGTFFEADLRVRPDEAGRARAWLVWARAEMERLEKIHSRHDPESELSALNRELSRPDILLRSLEVGPDLESVLFSSIEVWESSGGAFDVTIGPLIDVWLHAAKRGVWPSVEGLRRAKRRIGSGRLLLPGEGELGITTQGMRIDLDGISKGAVLDRLRERLRTDLPGVAALLSFGQSSVLALGDPEDASRVEGGGWLLELVSRDARGSRLGVIRLRDRALSVSSSVGSISEIAGQTISHIVDPRTGAIVEGTVEAVVVADRAAIADGWSTALLVLGAERGAIRLVEKAGLEATVFASAGRIASTEGWDALTAEVSP
ncbi:MAG: hypothetical protein GY910_18220 [bacterium]|nr:hypothetical protein [Deltaproteobacteria bacterium]MCP4906913.1 hypothetical protein [bacterium]